MMYYNFWLCEKKLRFCSLAIRNEWYNVDQDKEGRGLDIEYNLFIRMPAASQNTIQDLVEMWKATNSSI